MAAASTSECFHSILPLWNVSKFRLHPPVILHCCLHSTLHSSLNYKCEQTIVQMHKNIHIELLKIQIRSKSIPLQIQITRTSFVLKYVVLTPLYMLLNSIKYCKTLYCILSCTKLIGRALFTKVQAFQLTDAPL